MNKNYLIAGSFLLAVLAVTLVSAGVFDSITGNAIGDIKRCSPDNPCGVGEGDCRGRSNNCVENAFCNRNVGEKYGLRKNADVCEPTVGSPNIGESVENLNVRNDLSFGRFFSNIKNKGNNTFGLFTFDNSLYSVYIRGANLKTADEIIELDEDQYDSIYYSSLGDGFLGLTSIDSFDNQIGSFVTFDGFFSHDVLDSGKTRRIMASTEENIGLGLINFENRSLSDFAFFSDEEGRGYRLLMNSPNGNFWSCGPDNNGTWSCDTAYKGARSNNGFGIIEKAREIPKSQLP